MTADTLFQVGSITKIFTGTVVLRLVEQGKLRLDAPVREVLPGFRVQDETASQGATVRTLLTHMGGWEGDLFENPGDGDDALARMVERMAALEQKSSSGSRSGRTGWTGSAQGCAARRPPGPT